jgi:hypothetical protein
MMRTCLPEKEELPRKGQQRIATVGAGGVFHATNWVCSIKPSLAHMPGSKSGGEAALRPAPAMAWRNAVRLRSLFEPHLCFGRNHYKKAVDAIQSPWPAPPSIQPPRPEARLALPRRPSPIFRMLSLAWNPNPTNVRVFIDCLTRSTEDVSLGFRCRFLIVGRCKP